MTIATYILKYIKTLIKEHEGSVSDIGEGQNLVIYMPKATDLSSVTTVSLFGKRHIQPLLDEITDFQSQLSSDYPEFTANIKLAVDLNYVDQDTPRIDLESPAFWSTAEKIKEASPDVIRYTEAAYRVLQMNGADRHKNK